MPRLLIRAAADEGDPMIASVEIINESQDVIASRPVTRYKDSNLYFAFVDVPPSVAGPLLAVFLGADGKPLATVAAQAAPEAAPATQGSCWEVPYPYLGGPETDPTPGPTEGS